VAAGESEALNSFAPAIADQSTGNPTNLVKNGVGGWLLPNSNSYTGGTTISSGVLEIQNVNALGTGLVNVAAGAQLEVSIAGATNTTPNNITLNGLTFFTADGVELAGALAGDAYTGGHTNIFTGTVTLAATSNVSSSWSDKNVTLNGQVTGPGGLEFDQYAINFVAAGSHESFLVLGNTANNFQGGLIINDGTVVTSAAGVIPNGPGTGNVQIAANGNLNLDGNNESINALNGSGLVGTSTGTATLAVGNNNATGTFSGVISNTSQTLDGGGATASGTLALTKTGTGTQILTGNNSYTGLTSITAGTLNLSPTNSALTNNIANSSAINVGGNATFNVANVGGASANLFALNGTGTQTSSQILGGNGTVTGAVAISNGATLSAGTNSGTGKVNVVSSPASFTLLPATGTTDTIGTLTTGNLTLGATTGTSGNLAIRVSDAAGSGNAGTAGTNYDTISAGTITVPTSSPAHPFNVQLLGYGKSSGIVTANAASANFNSNTAYVWQIASYTSTNIPGAGNGTTVVLTAGGGQTVPSADSNLFSLDTSGFASANGITGAQTGAFYLEDVGTTLGAGSLDVVYNATPEPGTPILVLSAAIPMLMARRRRARGI